MKSCAEAYLRAHRTLKRVPELGSEDTFAIRRNHHRHAMQRHYPGSVQLCKLSCGDGFLDWKKMSHFTQLVDDDEDGIITLLVLRKPGDEIHLNMVDLPLGNGQRMQKT